MKVEYHKPGVYLHMTEAEYHSDPSLGSTDIKRLLRGRKNYWTWSRHHPYQFPKKKTDAMELGTAMHTRILMGKEVFDQKYAVSLDIDDHPHHLKSVRDLEDKLKSLGLRKGKDTTIAAMSAKIRAADPDALLWTEAQARHREKVGNRDLLDAAEMFCIEQAAMAIETSKPAVERLRGGRCEVSLFWRDAEFGTPLKARIDALRMDGWPADLKSFSNPFDKDIDKAVADAIDRLRYPIQALHYIEGLRVLRDQLRELCVDAGDPMTDFAFVFVESGPCPNIRVKTIGPTLDGAPNPIWTNAHTKVRHAIGLWKHLADTHGFDKPWVDPVTVDEVRPEELSRDSSDHAEEEMFV